MALTVNEGDVTIRIKTSVGYGAEFANGLGWFVGKGSGGKTTTIYFRQSDNGSSLASVDAAGTALAAVNITAYADWPA